MESMDPTYLQTPSPRAASNLDTIPVELIRRIASLGSFESAIALMQTNHTLRKACCDWTVFRDMSECSASSEQPRCHCATTLSSSSFRRKMSETDLARWCPAPGTAWINEAMVRAAPQWLPQTTAAHHPLTLTGKIKSLFGQLDRSSPLENQALQFCLVLRILSLEFPPDRLLCGAVGGTAYMSDGIRNVYAKVAQLYDDRFSACELRRDILLKHLGDHTAISTNFLSGACTLAELYAAAYEAMVVLVLEKRIEMASWRAAQEIGVGNIHPWDVTANYIGPIRPLTVDLSVPTAVSIPFLAFMKLPHPFSGQSTRKFTTCHLAAMTSSLFMEEGVWCGIATLVHSPLAEAYLPGTDASPWINHRPIFGSWELDLRFVVIGDDHAGKLTVRAHMQNPPPYDSSSTFTITRGEGEWHIASVSI
ncbi:hypothetical protein K402DRAFT_93126 [Aulographum hederae CBS 113979]|uniref:F-box domain-containing protein n=1 Tax=Aulographum hederae CBS 113979 TaxID=1176131 RepID=A0A6G1GZ51_9PEZI|nr:hypothetical protein K402DRAFT_93126 [Aulographum hederae CBS 113979]